jgi:hypothetical protein
MVTGGDVSAPLFPKDFVLHARSFGLLPTILSWLCPGAYLENHVFVLPLAAAALVVIRSQSLTLLGERWLAMLLMLSPMVHAWYFTWLIPFAVATRNAGSIAVSISAFAYFGIFGLPGVPRAGWPLLFLQSGMIWLPFICGFAWSELRRFRGQSEESTEIPEYDGDLRLSSL